MVIVNNQSTIDDTKIEESKTNVEVSNDIDDDNVPVIEDIKSTDDIDSILEELENYDDYDIEDIKSTDTNIDPEELSLEELEDYDSYDLEPNTTTISDTTDYNAKFEEFKSSLGMDDTSILSAIKWSDIDTFDKLEANFINNNAYVRLGTRWKLDYILSELGLSLNALKNEKDIYSYFQFIKSYFAKVQITNLGA